MFRAIGGRSGVSASGGEYFFLQGLESPFKVLSDKEAVLLAVERLTVNC